MGSIRRKIITKPKAYWSALFLLFFVFFPVFAQNDAPKSNTPLPLTAEISRLEKISSAGSGTNVSSRERFNAFLALSRLHQLSGYTEAALKAYEGALAISPDDGRVIVEYARFLISLGENEKAGAAINTLLGKEREKSLLIEGRYLGALLEAFQSGNTGPLSALAETPDFAEYRSGIYFTLWKITGLTLYKTKLTAEYPQSPEAKIISGEIDFTPRPMWLLFPGRVGLTPAGQLPPPAPVSQPQTLPAAPVGNTTRPADSTVLLQTGFFGREGNAQAFADRLKKAGFEPQLIRRQINGNDGWSVCVSGGTDMNATIRKLKEAGFDAFPIKQ